MHLVLSQAYVLSCCGFSMTRLIFCNPDSFKHWCNWPPRCKWHFGRGCGCLAVRMAKENLSITSSRLSGDVCFRFISEIVWTALSTDVYCLWYHLKWIKFAIKWIKLYSTLFYIMYLSFFLFLFYSLSDGLGTKQRASVQGSAEPLAWLTPMAHHSSKATLGAGLCAQFVHHSTGCSCISHITPDFTCLVSCQSTTQGTLLQCEVPKLSKSSHWRALAAATPKLANVLLQCNRIVRLEAQCLRQRMNLT